VSINFTFQKNGGFSSLRVLTESEGGEHVVWSLEDTSIFADDEWLIGQVEVGLRKVVFEAVKGAGDEGWATIDDIHVEKETQCIVIPTQAAPATSTAMTDTTPHPGTTFNYSGLCCKGCFVRTSKEGNINYSSQLLTKYFFTLTK
jgi:hypothetical protein